jgi:hypothetical protein
MSAETETRPRLDTVESVTAVCARTKLCPELSDSQGQLFAHKYEISTTNDSETPGSVAKIQYWPPVVFGRMKWRFRPPRGTVQR